MPARKSTDFIEMAGLDPAGIVRKASLCRGDQANRLGDRSYLSRTESIRFRAGGADATQADPGLAGAILDEVAYAAWLRADVRPKAGTLKFISSSPLRHRRQTYDNLRQTAVDERPFWRYNCLWSIPEDAYRLYPAEPEGHWRTQ
jgi:hypothetical protein